MIPESRHRHTIDMLFLLTLFLVFALSAFMLISLGANIYQKTADRMESNYSLRTSFSYVTEKLRQSDREGAVQIGSFDGCPALILSQEIEGEVYLTYLYEDGGYLKELFAKSGNQLSKDAGRNIFPVREFSLEMLPGSLYRFTLIRTDGNATTLYLHSQCSQTEENL